MDANTTAETSLGEWATPDEVETYLGIPAATLAQWRHRGVGPTYAKFGRHVRYHGPTTAAWATAQVVAKGQAA